jgi:hypothetical protein
MIAVFRVKTDGRIICGPEKLTDKEEGNLTEGRESYVSTHSEGTRKHVQRPVCADTMRFI